MSEIREQVIALHKVGLSNRKIASVLPISKSAVWSILNQEGIHDRTRGNAYGLRKYEFDQDYFSKIDTQEKAYWLGFINADGHVSRDGVTVVIKADDVKHLEKFASAIKSPAPIKHCSKTKSVRFTAYSYRMVNDLRNLGLPRQKSKEAILPAVDAAFLPHLIRGIFDGDGCLAKSSTRDQYAVSFSGTISVVKSIRSVLSANLTVSEPDISQDTENTNFGVIAWGGQRQVAAILDWFYRDATVYLERKYDRYKQVMEIESKYRQFGRRWRLYENRCNGA